jgi:hypothetical protein
MKVFVSSIIAGFEPVRQAARTAVTTLRHQPIMAEDFGAQPASPQVSCLQGLRASEVVLLILGEKYGAVQPKSGLSATHEEYRDAKGSKPIIAFVQSGIAPAKDQADFITEVQGWEGGLFRGSFTDADDINANIIRALHDYELANATGPLNPEALVERAVALLPPLGRNASSSATLHLGIAGDPLQSILRPAEIEKPALAEAVHQAALFGPVRFFDTAEGVNSDVHENGLIVSQKNGSRVQLTERGSLLISVPVNTPTRDRNYSYAFPAIIEEVVAQRLGAALGYAEWLLEHVDLTQRLTQVAIAVRINCSDHMAWRTQQEQDASPNSGTIGFSSSQEKRPVHVSRPRAALRLDRSRLVEDLVVALRRQMKSR